MQQACRAAAVVALLAPPVGLLLGPGRRFWAQENVWQVETVTASVKPTVHINTLGAQRQQQQQPHAQPLARGAQPLLGARATATAANRTRLAQSAASSAASSEPLAYSPECLASGLRAALGQSMFTAFNSLLGNFTRPGDIQMRRALERMAAGELEPDGAGIGAVARALSRPERLCRLGPRQPVEPDTMASGPKGSRAGGRGCNRTRFVIFGGEPPSFHK